MSALTDVLAWVVVAGFISSAFFQRQEGQRDVGRLLASGSWVTFGVFWALLVPHFAFVQMSPIEGVLSAIAVPASLYVAYLIWSGRRDFATLTRAIAIMGIIYLPFEMSAVLQRTAIEMVTTHTEMLMTTVGYDPTVIQGPDGHRSTFEFVGDGHIFVTTVVLACTGIGSSATVSGLVLALDAPIRRRLLGVAIAVPVIYGLNVIRVGFIALAHGHQWFADFQRPVFFLFGTDNPYMVSYLIADRVLAQSLSVVALVGLTLALLRLLPELATIVEDVLFLVTGKSYDIRSLL
ncbi:cytochrome oxidase subunit I [Halanaeroarchaeum sulfurireducens]|uniref:Cytochrome oxidase subunit I n=2 Tax=Halanaeroarchaeum sulfurireducens TaxID=1604004 RepID=A0A0F7P9I4_9EURY|nr:cytochrome oxidase subunit I [Halanaeroarchaeum sulfurireducens]ALG81267.1 cytochrome oxidase subunit I [Halanaeroarchaeum sulfurireducens]